jgi:hypothetical protein
MGTRPMLKKFFLKALALLKKNSYNQFAHLNKKDKMASVLYTRSFREHLYENYILKK